MIAALTEAIAAGSADPSIRVIVIRSLGPAFSAGHDLRETRRRDGEDQPVWEARIDQKLRGLRYDDDEHPARPQTHHCQRTGDRQRRRLPTGLRLRSGYCLRGRHLLYAGVNIGTFCTTPLVGIGQKISRKHALEMALTGDQFDAATAERFGLINRSVPAAELEQATRELAGKIASRSAESIARGKSAFISRKCLLIRRSSWPTR